MTTNLLRILLVSLGFWAGTAGLSASSKAQTPNSPSNADEASIVSASGSTLTVIGLGYPVPTPIPTQFPGSHYRTLEGIRSRLRSLSGNGVASGLLLGPSTNGAEINGICISDSDSIRDDGSPEPVMIVTGGIHAREWISPEVTLRVAERFLDPEELGTAGRLKFLNQNVEICLIPVLNPDGFHYAQENATRTVAYTGGASFYADGRFRRKNLAGHQDALFLPVAKVVPVPPQFPSEETHTFEGLLGVDLNRNFEVGYAAPDGDPPNSDDLRDEDFRGRADTTGNYRLSDAEAESRALVPFLQSMAGRLVTFVDVHSFSKWLILQRTTEGGAGERDIVGEALRQDMIDITGYTAVTYEPDQASGTLDTFVGNLSNQPLSYTIELPPERQPQSIQKFSMPATEVGPTADSVMPIFDLLADFTAGPAYVRKIVIWQDRSELGGLGGSGDGLMDPLEIVYEAQWDADPIDNTKRVLNLRQARSLEPGEARILITFSEPMKYADDEGTILPAGDELHPTVQLQVPGIASPIEPTPISHGWLYTPAEQDQDGVEAGYNLYEFDTWQGEFNWSGPAAGAAGAPSLQISMKDLDENELDAKPDTVAIWNQRFEAYESTGGTGTGGGIDQSQTLLLDTTKPSISITIDRPSVELPGPNS